MSKYIVLIINIRLRQFNINLAETQIKTGEQKRVAPTA
jgi:hypothetical protein